MLMACYLQTESCTVFCAMLTVETRNNGKELIITGNKWVLGNSWDQMAYWINIFSWTDVEQER